MLPWIAHTPCDMTALSVDGSFMEQDGTSAVGMVLRRYDRSVIFSAYHFLFNCNEALEVEIHALMIGMALSRQHAELPVMDLWCSLTLRGLDRSDYGHLVAEIKSLMAVRKFVPQKLHRSQNRDGDCLTRYSRSERATAVWLGRGPPCIEELLPKNCSSTLME